MQYNEKVLNEFFNPQNVGVIKGASGKGKIVSPTDREIMKIYITVEDDVVTNAMFQTFGCVGAIACTSVATRLMIGKTVDEALNITTDDILSELGGALPENKMHCVTLAEETVKDAIASYESKKKGIKRATEDDD